MRCSSYRKIEEYFFKSKLTSLFDLAEAKINLSGLTKIAFELIFLNILIHGLNYLLSIWCNFLRF